MSKRQKELKIEKEELEAVAELAEAAVKVLRVFPNREIEQEIGGVKNDRKAKNQ